MKPVFQTHVDKGLGNCHQAVIASLFELELDMVPNFIKFKRPLYHWAQIYSYFIQSLDYEFCGTHYLTKHRRKFELDTFLDEQYSVNGFFDAAVPSRTFEGVSHAVVIDMRGIVVHDPNPNGLWLNEYVLEEEKLLHYSLIKKGETSESVIQSVSL